MQEPLRDLPAYVQQGLKTLVEAFRDAFQSQLKAVILFGSAAEGRLRATSDVNLLVVAESFDINKLNPLRQTLRMAHTSIRSNVMFLDESEVESAADAFAVKFSDIHHRHRLLYGEDVIAALVVPDDVKISRLQQVVLNLMMRLREQYALLSIYPDQLVSVIAEATGPLRSYASILLDLEKKKYSTSKEALQLFSARVPGDRWPQILSLMSHAREEKAISAEEASDAMLGMLQLLEAMKKRIQELR